MTCLKFKVFLFACVTCETKCGFVSFDGGLQLKLSQPILAGVSFGGSFRCIV